MEAFPFSSRLTNVDDRGPHISPEKVDGNYLLYHRVNNQICADLLLLIRLRNSREPLYRGDGSAPRDVGREEGRKCRSSNKSRGQVADDLPRCLAPRDVSPRRCTLDSTGTSVLARTADPVFEPVETYEKEGEVPNVVFSCGAVVRGDTIYLYYGAADRVIGVATASLAHMLDDFRRQNSLFSTSMGRLQRASSHSHSKWELSSCG